MPLQELTRQVVDSTLSVQTGGTFHIDETIEANQNMKKNTASGKIVVLT
jgi:hypothetical protein